MQPGYSIIILKTIEPSGTTLFRAALAVNLSSVDEQLTPFNIQHTFRNASVTTSFDGAQRYANEEEAWYHRAGGTGTLTRYLLNYNLPYPTAQDVADYVLASNAVVLFGMTRDQQIGELKNWIRGVD